MKPDDFIFPVLTSYSGVRLEIIHAILGHLNIQQTMRYRHIINDELNKAISIIE